MARSRLLENPKRQLVRPTITLLSVTSKKLTEMETPERLSDCDAPITTLQPDRLSTAVGALVEQDAPDVTTLAPLSYRSSSLTCTTDSA